MPEGKTPTFETLAAEWIQIKRQNIRESTACMYAGHLKNHFSDLNPLQINRITVRTAENLIASKREAGMNIGTLKKIIVTFNQVMGYAVRHRHIEHNPVRDAERPRSQGEAGGLQIKVLSVESDRNTCGIATEPNVQDAFQAGCDIGRKAG